MSDPGELLERSFKRTARMNLIMGVLVGGMGLFMIALHLFELDPETKDMGTGGLVALYGFAALFLAVGVGGFWMALIKTPRDAREIRALVANSPEQIARFWRFTTTGTGSADGVGAQNFVKIQLRSEKVHQLSVRKEDLQPILDYLGSQALQAVRGEDEIQRVRT